MLVNIPIVNLITLVKVNFSNSSRLSDHDLSYTAVVKCVYFPDVNF